MAQVAGITTNKNTKGELTHVTIDVKKHKDAIAPLLEQLGITTKTQFQIDRERGITIEEARALSIPHLKSLNWKK